MRVAVVTFPGSNRDRDLFQTFQTFSSCTPLYVAHSSEMLPEKVDCVCLPGGFSYGDYLRCGALAARTPILKAIRHYADTGGMILGICNGFQILIEAGLLPGALICNRNLKFACRQQALRVERNDTLFTKFYEKDEILQVGVAHHQGQYIASPELLAQLEAQKRIAFRYCDSSGRLTEAANPNGSANHIAGIYSENFKILGFMPHFENFADPALGRTSGIGLFDSLLQSGGASELFTGSLSPI